MSMELIHVSKNGEDPFMIDEPESVDDGGCGDQQIEDITTQIQQMCVGKEKEEMEVEVENICDKVESMCLTHIISQNESDSSNEKMKVEKRMTFEGIYFIKIFFWIFFCRVVYR